MKKLEIKGKKSREREKQKQATYTTKQDEQTMEKDTGDRIFFFLARMGTQ